MNSGRLVFSQVMDHVPAHTFRRCVARYNGNFRGRSFSCLDQFLCMSFAQLTRRESLRDIEACLRVHQDKLWHMGVRGRVSRSTLADANEMRDFRIYADLAQTLIKTARAFYADETFSVDLDHTVYALDSTIIDLCLQLFPWTPFQHNTAAVKVHALIDLAGNIPAFIRVSEARMGDGAILDELITEPGAFYIMDRGYLDFERLYALNQRAAFFVLRPRKNTLLVTSSSRPVDRSTGLICDQIVKPGGAMAKKNYPACLRKVSFRDREQARTYTFLTNNMTLPPLTIAQLYKARWQVELFFKWIKQNLRLRHFFGTSPNAVKTQIWIAVCTYLIVAIIKKRTGSPHQFQTIMQILSLTTFEKIQLNQLLNNPDSKSIQDPVDNQLNLLDY